MISWEGIKQNLDDIPTLQANGPLVQNSSTFSNFIHPNQRFLLPPNIGNKQEATWREKVGGNQTAFKLADTCYYIYLDTVLIIFSN